MKEADSDTNPLVAEAIALAGNSESKLAAAAGCSQVAINKAKKAKRVSAEMAVRIEQATDGKIPRWRLRPDLWPQPEERVAS